MKKFDALFAEQFSKLNEAPPADGTAQDPNADPATSTLPPAGAVPADTQPEPLTAEGKVFLIDLARKALAFNPQQLPEFDTEVLGTTVTPQNADAVLKDIQRIVGTN
jgi:hypothetical protein